MYRFGETVPWKYHQPEGPRRPRHQSSKPRPSVGGVGEPEAQELLKYYERVISTDKPDVKATYFEEIKQLLEDWGYVDYVYNSAVEAFAGHNNRNRNPGQDMPQRKIPPNLYSNMQDMVYPEYKARALTALSSDDLARAIVRAPAKILNRPYKLKPETKIRMELFNTLHNILFQVVNEKAADLGLDELWSNDWRQAKLSVDTLIEGGEGTTILDTIAAPAKISDPAVMMENVAIPELAGSWSAIFVPEILDDLREKIKDVTDPTDLSTIVSSEVQAYAQSRMGITEDEDEYAHWQDTEDLDRIVKCITAAILRARSGEETPKTE